MIRSIKNFCGHLFTAGNPLILFLIIMLDVGNKGSPIRLALSNLTDLYPEVYNILNVLVT